MNVRRWILPVLVVSAVLFGPALVAPPAAAADVNVSLFAANFAWHVGSAASAETAIRVTVGDTIHLTIVNNDAADHTFTAPHFPAATGQVGAGPNLNVNLSVGATFVWNHTVTASDVGTWQYYCIPHSSGTYPNRAGMVGTIVVSQPGPPPPTPGFEAVLVVAAIAGAAVLVRLAPRRK